MKRLNLLLAALLLVSGMTFAQGRPEKGNNMSVEERAQKMTEDMTKKLSLNEQQKGKVQEINLAFLQEMQSQRGTGKNGSRTENARPSHEGNKNGRDRKAAMDAAKETRNAKLKEVLTAEQYALYQKDDKNDRPKEEKKK